MLICIFMCLTTFKKTFLAAKSQKIQGNSPCLCLLCDLGQVHVFSDILLLIACLYSLPEVIIHAGPSSTNHYHYPIILCPSTICWKPP